MPDPFAGLLGGFDAVGLAEIESVALLDRTDTKYLLPVGRLPAILAAIADDYRVLEVAGRRATPYETLYFDTPRLDCYRRHHAGRAVRTKVRARRYASTGDCFVEVKRRDNHARTIKRRLPVEGIPESLTGGAARFVGSESGLDPGSLAGTLWVDYLRATLVGRRSPERVTIDRGLDYRGADGGRFAGLMIVEVKRPRAAAPSAVGRELQRRGVFPAGVSKYCLGMVTTHPGIPRNNFLASLRHVDRVLHAAG